MFNEYQLADFESRISKLEKQIKEPTFCHIIEQKERLISASSHTLNFDFSVKAKTYLKVKFKIEVLGQTNFSAILYLNDCYVNDYSFSNSEGEFEFLLPVKSGKNRVSIVCSSDGEFTVQNCIFETFGNIFYVEENYYLSHIIEEDRTLILFSCGQNATLKNYSNGALTLINEWEQIKSIATCVFGDKYLVAYIKNTGEGVIEIYDNSFVKLNQITFDSNLISLCALNGESATLFCVKGNVVYKYTVNQNLNIEVVRTQYKAKKVQSNPQVTNCIIITDYNGFAKLVTL